MDGSEMLSLKNEDIFELVICLGDREVLSPWRLVTSSWNTKN